MHAWGRRGEGGWASRVGKPGWGLQGVRVRGTEGQWKGPVGIRSWRTGGPAKGELAIGVLRQARRRGLPPASVLGESGEAAAQLLKVLAGWGGH